jgi:hypothetical protein
MRESRFYVYQLSDGKTVRYVGKGSGKRLKNQIASTGLFGEIVKRFKSEREAYKYEVSLINRLNPPLNKNRGGAGGLATVPVLRHPAWVYEMGRVGSRRYTAQQLLRFDLSGHLSASEIDTIRQVANGPRV